MIVVRLEFETLPHKVNQAIEAHKSFMQEGGSWHGKTRGYRIYRTSLSGPNNRVVVEMNFENLAEWESVFEEVFPNIPDQEWALYNSAMTGKDHVSYWKLVDEG